MAHKTVLVVAGLIVFFLFALAPSVSAQGLQYPGPFVDGSPATPGPLGWAALDITIEPTPKPEPDVTTTAPMLSVTPRTANRVLPIAHTGTESYLLAYVGTGLVAFGAAALGMRRRYLFADDDY